MSGANEIVCIRDAPTGSTEGQDCFLAAPSIGDGRSTGSCEFDLLGAPSGSDDVDADRASPDA
jgi:hypothetical protein